MIRLRRRGRGLDAISTTVMLFGLLSPSTSEQQKAIISSRRLLFCYSTPRLKVILVFARKTRTGSHVHRRSDWSIASYGDHCGDNQPEID